MFSASNSEKTLTLYLTWSLQPCADTQPFSLLNKGSHWSPW